MKKVFLAFAFTLSSLAALVAQTPETKKAGSPREKSVGLTLGLGGGSFTSALHYEYLWKLGKTNRWGIGLGARLTNSFGSNQNFTTAPAKLTSGKTGPGVFFAEDIDANIDTVIFKNHQINALNLSLNFHCRVSKALYLGFNIDAIGFSFGAQQNGQYLGNNGIGSATAGKPTAFNLLLISDNDLGSLNSELYLKYDLNKKWGAKLGFQYLFQEFTTNTLVQTTPDNQKNDRFRNKASGLSLGITYKL